jgi:hypothetical protein
VAFISMPTRLCGCARRGRQGAAGIPMASHMAAANALLRHAGRKAAAHVQGPAEAAAAGFFRANASVLQLCCARCQRASCSATWRSSSPSRSASPSWSAQPPLIYLPRAARLRKYREMRAGRGCHSGASLHAGAPVTTAAIGNLTTADRLSAGPRASDVANTSNFTLKFHKK